MEGVRDELIAYLKQLQDAYVRALEVFEPVQKFVRKEWRYDKGEGGGVMALLRGDVFEKAAVNWSGLSGDDFPLKEGLGPFFATGVSLIVHPANPHAPTSHFNVRYIETKEKNWFGGGFDLTPMLAPFPEDTAHFHDVAKKALDRIDPKFYPQFSKQAKEYFFIPHYKKERGVGGIFFDHYNSGDRKKDVAMWKEVGDSFLEAILPIYNKRVDQPFSAEDRETQLRKRGEYVEFNLLYDQGTRFGFSSGGNPEAILCSLPPLVKW